MKKNLPKLHVEKVEVKCKAIADGYTDRIIKEGSVFTYKGNLVDGRFPRWCEPVKKFVSEFDKRMNKMDDLVPEGEEVQGESLAAELSPQQKAAATRAKNKALKAADLV